MSDKGGSDLDIFNDLAKKSAGTGAAPDRPQSTLLGLQAPGFPAPSRPFAAPPANTGRTLPPPPTRPRTTVPPPAPSLRSGPPPSVAQNPKPNGNGSSATSPTVEMDWDDEDEKTTVYDKSSPDEGGRGLLSSAGSGRPPPIPSVPPRGPGLAQSLPPPLSSAPRPPSPAALRATLPPARQPAAPTRPANRQPLPPPASQVPHVPAIAAMPAPTFRPKRSPVMLGAVAVLALSAAAIFFAWPRTGTLVITVSGPANKPLDAVDILVNGDRKCVTSPCSIEGLKADTYYVRAHAAGYQTMADIAVAVSPSSKAVQNLTLVRAVGTGVKVLGEGTGLKLYVDGREMGPLPQEIKDMEPGDHVIKVAGGERFEPFEKRVTVEPEQMQTIGPLKLRVLKGLATIQAGTNADGARVLLVSGADRRSLSKLPITLDIPTNVPHTLVATRSGYEPYEETINFEDGQVERTFEVSLEGTEKSAAQESRHPAPSQGPGHGGRRPSFLAGNTTGDSIKEPEAPKERPPASTGMATLNINSIPVTNVIVDGRPLGATPKIGVQVSAGSHTVVFVGENDRKVSSVTVGSGETKTVAVRF